ncbi:MAG TPA: ABC transporter permease [Pyrinomonadaceae bacterium]|nr:ABC transporter permease [Pyrinomonadaceae bacterium]
MSDRFIKIGSSILIIVACASLLAPLIRPPTALSHAQPFSSPSWSHPLGTDDVGHDVLADLLYGGRASLIVGLIVGIFSTTLGLAVGGLAGYVRSLDVPLMRAIDMLLVIPRLPLIIFLSLFLKPSLWNVVLILSIFGWPLTARTVRPVIKSLRDRDFVVAARSIGAGDWYILRRHIFPQLYSIFAVQLVLEARQAVLAEAGLGFLGLEDPTTKSWGMMLSYAFNHEATFLSDAWQWTVLPPALVLTVFILSLSLIGVGLESYFNPKLKPWTVGPDRDNPSSRLFN